MRERLASALGPLLGLLLFVAAAVIVQREFAEYRLGDVLAHVHAIPPRRLALAVVVTALSYVLLTGYDLLALRWIGSRIGYLRIAIASFVAYAFSHNVGLSFLGGSAVRYRMFTAWGVAPGELARAIAFSAVTFWLGYFVVAGAVLCLVPLSVPGALHAWLASSRPLGGLLLALAATYVAVAVGRRRPVHVRGFTLQLPGATFTAAQLVLSSLDWTVAASAVWVLLPPVEGLGFGRVLGAVLLSQLLGLISHVPGGVGVFETAMVVLLRPWLPGDQVLGALVAYRLVYYVAPLALAIPLLLAHELLLRSATLRRGRRALARVAPEVVPRVLALTTFAGGVVLLVSGATPAMAGRMGILERLLPLPVLEVSHLLGSAMGMMLLLLARAIQQRVDAAYAFALALLAGGALVSLLKGLDWEEATLLVLMFLALAPCHRYFYRRSSLASQSFTPAWIASVLGVLIATGVLTLLAHRDVEYSHALWWQFDVTGHASRSLRALAGAAALLGAWALARLLRPAVPTAPLPGPAELDRVAAIVRASPQASAHLALLGDKQLLLHESGTGFVMYGVQRRSWVSMGDPVAPRAIRAELAWRFRELADRHAGLAVFYEVGADDLPVYLDLGLSLYKLGEEARVRLTRFSLEGGARKGLRQAHGRMRRDGCGFELLPREAVPPLLDELEGISDAWLEHKHTREKRFSLGRFDRAYLARTPLAVVRRADRIVAFANVWAPDVRVEMSVDLMRSADEAPPGVMEFLFVELMLWGRDQGFEWFSLGMAPFSGLEIHRFSPLWNRLGALLFRHGEHFYNFQGLRAFKDKFDPVWEPRFLASPGAFTTPFVLTDIAALVSGGVTGVATR